MVLISKNDKIALEEFYFVECRLLTANVTENGTLPWVFLFYFVIEVYCPCYQITQSIAECEL